MQGCERKLGLSLNADPAQNSHALGAVSCVLEQRRLADPRFATDYQDAALTVASVVEEAVDRRGLRAPPDKHRSGDRTPGTNWGLRPAISLMPRAALSSSVVEVFGEKRGASR